MRAIICNPSYGNNPYLRTAEMALELRTKLGEEVSVVVPDLYGDKQRRILREEFGDVPIIVDSTFGTILSTVCFDGTSFTVFLGRWLSGVDSASAAAKKHLEETYDIVCEISRAPLLELGITPAYYNSWSRLSELYKRAAEEDVGIDPALLKKASKRMERIEAGYRMHLVNVPGTFDPGPDDIAIPLSAPLSLIEKDPGGSGVYVTTSGIPQTASLQHIAECFGVAIYANDPSRLPGAHKAHPSILASGKMTAHIARAGWGSIWTSILTETPIVTPAYVKDEDPEIFFNNARIQELGLGTVFADQSGEELMEEVQRLRPRITAYKQTLLKQFGTLEGSKVAADHIAKDLLSKA